MSISFLQFWLLCGLATLAVSLFASAYVFARAVSDRAESLRGVRLGVVANLAVVVSSTIICLIGGPLALAACLTPATWRSCRMIACHPRFNARDVLTTLVVVKVKDEYVMADQNLSPNPLDGEVYTLPDARRRYKHERYQFVPLDRIKAV